MQQRVDRPGESKEAMDGKKKVDNGLVQCVSMYLSG